VIACVLALCVSGTAAGSTQTTKDPRGDAPSRIDITKVTYTYDASHVSVEARIPRLGATGDASLSISPLQVFEAGYVARAERKTGGVLAVGLYYFDHFALRKRKCAGIEGTWGSGRIGISVPVTCLVEGFPSSRAFVQFAIGDGGELDRARAVKRLAQRQ
jgi:hypothetical protein